MSASTAAAGAAGDIPRWTATPEQEAANGAAGHDAAALIGGALQGMGLGPDPWGKLAGGVARAKPHKAGDAAFAALRQAQARSARARGGAGAGANPDGRWAGRALAARRTLCRARRVEGRAPLPAPPPPPNTLSKRPPPPPPQERDGRLRLAHFRRVKQLGAGDVGLVDLVTMQGSGLKFAMKTLDKWEMAERNKVSFFRGRVLRVACVVCFVWALDKWGMAERNKVGGGAVCVGYWLCVV